MGVWTRRGSDKAQASQTIRILIRSLQSLAENMVDNEVQFMKIVVPVIRNLFTPAATASVNEQVSELLDNLGWKNSEITIASADRVNVVLGSNRHLQQDPEFAPGLKLLVKTVTTASGYYLLNKEVDSVVDINFTSGITYRVTLSASHFETPKVTQEPPVKAEPTETKQVVSAPKVESIAVDIDASLQTDQLFLPIISSKLPLNTTMVMLRDVLTEFIKSWYSTSPLEGLPNLNPSDEVKKLVLFLVEKTIEAGRSTKVVGNQIGRFFAQTMQNRYMEEYETVLSDEILESNTSVIIRDIKAMSLCNLSPGQKCVPANRGVCDFGMGIYEGVLSHLLEKQFEFKEYFAAGKNDTYCLMEFHEV